MRRNSIDDLSLVELGILYCCIGNVIMTVEDAEELYGDEFSELLSLLKRTARDVKQAMRELERG